ncbi:MULTISPECIES: hypothetical protein [unclassified Microbacterium]|uniref:hypothetical protein n=1 Tax=unclassified Microbacterium TaxID=2609290 RepID=UPI0030185B46
MTADSGTVVSLVLEDLDELFTPRPVDPLHGRFDDRTGFEYLVETVDGSADGLRIDITVTGSTDERRSERQIADALGGFAIAHSERLESEKARIRRLGFRELLFGLIFLAACLLGGSAVAVLDIGPHWVRTFLGEGLVIVGWIALWHPVDMLFFEHLPLAREQRVLARLAAASVRLVGADD